MGDYAGRYGQHGAPGLEIAERDVGLLFRFPGAPQWLDGMLADAGEDAFRIETGPLAGARIHFERDADGSITKLRLGRALELPAHPDPDPPTYCLAPPRAHDAARDVAFEALYERAFRSGNGERVEYRLAYPRHQFLSYLSEEKGLLFHGSNEHEILEFEPRGQTLEPTQQQSELAVSACADGLWAMAYAILDRSRYQGSFHNGVIPLPSTRGEVRLYHFSIGQEFLSADPPIFSDGTVYLLAPEPFERMTQGPLGPNSLEFLSTQPVRPLARLDVRPSDFPLLSKFGGHDDSAVRQATALRGRLFAEVAEATPLDDGYELSFDPRPGLHDERRELAKIERRFHPWIEVTLELPPARTRALLRLSGSAGLRDRIARNLERSQREEETPTS